MKITNKILIIFYILLYIIYVIFGYSIWEKLYFNENPVIANTDINSINFIGRRVIQLSTVSLLLSAYFFYKPSKVTYVCICLVHLSIYIIFPIKWKITPENRLINYITHILTGLPVLLYPLYGTFTETNKYSTIEISMTIIILIIYYFLQDYIYKS